MKLKQQFRHTLPLDSERGLDQARAYLRHSMGEDLEAPLYTFEALANDLEKKDGDTWIVEVLQPSTRSIRELLFNKWILC